MALRQSETRSFSPGIDGSTPTTGDRHFIGLRASRSRGWEADGKHAARVHIGALAG
jgi:hypothetical protein